MPFPALKRIESAVDTCVQILRESLNTNLALVYSQHSDVLGTGKYNLPKVPVDRYYIAEAVQPLLLPAVFVLADRTSHDLSAQQWAKQTHHLAVAVLLEDTEQQRLTRVVWRYAEALFLSLHDRGRGQHRFLVDEIGYSPLFTESRAGGERKYRKDVTSRVRAISSEAF